MRQDTAYGILKTGRNVFLTGAPGTGKTYVLRRYLSYLAEQRATVAVTAATGIAATHIGGYTLHSFVGIGTRTWLRDWELDALMQKEYVVRRLRGIDVLVVDEVSMLSGEVVDTVDVVLRAARGNDRPFGGVQVVFSGDFFQLPPVDKEGTCSFAYQSSAWQSADIRIAYLTEQYRQDDSTFIELLSAIREGRVTSQHRQLLQTRYKAPLTHPAPTILFTHNHDVDAYNARQLESLPGKTRHFKAQMGGSKKHAERLLAGMLAPEELVLKEGARVLFVKNDPHGRFVNGTQGVVHSFRSGLPVVRLASGEEVVAEPMEWRLEEDGRIRAWVKQVPLRLAWAITVHKSQGMTLEAAQMDLSSAFVPGQGYVALSRVRRLESLSLDGLSEAALQVSESVVQFDVRAREESERWERVFEGYSERRRRELHEAFRARVGGKGRREDTVAQTAALMREGSTYAEIAAVRELTAETIVRHAEQLLARGGSIPDSFFDLDEATYRRVCIAADVCGWESLKALKERVDVDYLTLRLARLRAAASGD